MASRDAYEALWMAPISEAAALGLVDTDVVLVQRINQVHQAFGFAKA